MIRKVKQLGLLGLNYIRYRNICNFDYDIIVDV